MILIDGEGTPLSVFTLGANVAEVHAIENLVDVRQTDRKPERLLYDKPADADWLRDAMDEREIELICPHRRNRTNHRDRTAARSDATAGGTRSNGPSAG